MRLFGRNAGFYYWLPIGNSQMKWKKESTAFSSAGYQQVFKSLNLSHDWNGRAHSLIILGQSLMCFHGAGNLSPTQWCICVQWNPDSVFIQICQSRCWKLFLITVSTTAHLGGYGTETHTRAHTTTVHLVLCTAIYCLHFYTVAQKAIANYEKKMECNVTINQCNFGHW